MRVRGTTPPATSGINGRSTVTADVTSLETARPAATGAHQSTGRTAAAGLIGNVLEWFDFAVYGYFATVIGQQFFPQSSPGAQQLLSFAVFALGFGARPIGSLVLGRVGDRIGRRPLLVLSIAMMGVSTLLIGLLPNLRVDRRRGAAAAHAPEIDPGFLGRWRVHGLDGLHDRILRRSDARLRQQFDCGRHDTRVHPRLGVGVDGACAPRPGRGRGLGLAHSVRRQLHLLHHRLVSAPGPRRDAGRTAGRGRPTSVHPIAACGLAADAADLRHRRDDERGLLPDVHVRRGTTREPGRRRAPPFCSQTR